MCKKWKIHTQKRYACPISIDTAKIASEIDKRL